jgi:hypothetical protein
MTVAVRGADSAARHPTWVAPTSPSPARTTTRRIVSFAEPTQQAVLPMGLETIVFIVVIILIVLFVTGYFGRGRISR